MPTRRRIRRLVLPLTAALLAAGCATQPKPTDQDVTSPGGPAARLPLTVPNVESCTNVRQRQAAAPASDQRLLDISLPCLTAGSAVNPARLAGRPTVVNLWATWCQPCRQEMPILQKAAQRHGDRVQFLGVNTKDQPDWAAEFLQEVKVTYPQVVDTDGRLLNSLRSPGLPVTVVLDPQGQIAGRHIGRISEQQLTELVADANR